MRRLAAVASFVIVAVIVVAMVAAATLLMGPLPSRRGRLVLPHLKAPVTVRFDRQGVPHVRAVLETDAWRALGFIHASDRLFQMELRRRAARGRLAEQFGKAALEMDKTARIHGYTAGAQRDWELLPPDERAVLTAYAEGVNAFLAEQYLPLELQALSLTPDPWTPIDSLAFGRLLQDQLSGAESAERSAFDDALVRGIETAIASYDETEPGSTHVAPEIQTAWGELRRSEPSRTRADTAPAGSNAWALDGTHTASGKPLLAGDPHLAAERPGVWYGAHLTSDDGLDAVGLTLAGLPGIVIGHNGRVAWSLTMHQADDADLYLERVDWDKQSYLRDGAWIPLAHASETIHVKGAADVTLDVWRTGHGPIVLRLDATPNLALARAFAPEGLPQGPRVFLDAARAKNGSELVAAWSRFAGPSVNVCWADASGSVGLKVAGAIPQRGEGDGRFPVPGWLSRYDWMGTMAASDLPAVDHPRDGLVVSANDDWRGVGVRLPYPGLFADADRAARARQLGAGLRAATVADMRAMQTDVYSAYAARIVGALRRSSFANPRAAKAAAILAAWDAHADARGPSRLFYAFMKELAKDLKASGGSVSWSILEKRIAAGDTNAIEGALSRALDRVSAEEGDDPKRWSFGRAHRLTYPHPFASVMPPFLARRLEFGPVALPGEWHTLDVAGFSLRGDHYDVTHIPSARFIVDLADPDASRLALPLGQSGQLFDRHAHDQLDAWSSGRDFALPFTAPAVDAATISMLLFVPGD